MNDEPKILKWFEVTWVTASGRTLVKAEGEGEARMLASQYGGEPAKKGTTLADGKLIIHEWLEVVDNDPFIFDVEELAEDTAAELRRDMEAG